MSIITMTFSKSSVRGLDDRLREGDKSATSL